MLIGHKRIWNFLIKSAKNGRLAHAYLFVGAAQVGKRTLALEFARWLLCNKKIDNLACGKCRSCLDIEKKQHPDIFILAPRQEEKKGVIKTLEIGIDEIKELQHRLSLFSFGSSYKVAIIDGIDGFTREAANSFLKTLEEPQKNTLIILTSSNWQAVLPTIVSRCQLIKFLPVTEKEILDSFGDDVLNKADLKKLMKLSVNRPGRIIEFMNRSEVIKNNQENSETFKKILKSDLVWRWELAKQLSQNTSASHEFLSQWLLWLRDKLLENQGLASLAIDSGARSQDIYPQQKIILLAKEILRTQTILNNSSFNSKLALELLMLKI